MTLTDILLRPIPTQEIALGRKAGYRHYPILDGRHNDESLIDIGLYGIAGQSYYARPNKATGEAVPGVEAPIKVRKGLAERLAAINYALQNSDEVAEIFGGQVELYIDEGLRTFGMQSQLYEEIFPQLIRQQNPDYTEDQVMARRDQLIARPSDAHSPSPHATGAAVDIKLRFANQDLGYVPKVAIPLRAPSAGVDYSANADFFETKSQLTEKEKQYARNRRVFYWVMRGALLGDDSGLACNPSEIWHWSYGDQMWAALTQAPYAFFDAVKD